AQRDERARISVRAVQNLAGQLARLCRVSFRDRLRCMHDRLDVLTTSIAEPPAARECLACQLSLTELLMQLPKPVVEIAVPGGLGDRDSQNRPTWPRLRRACVRVRQLRSRVKACFLRRHHWLEPLDRFTMFILEKRDAAQEVPRVVRGRRD